MKSPPVIRMFLNKKQTQSTKDRICAKIAPAMTIPVASHHSVGNVKRIAALPVNRRSTY